MFQSLMATKSCFSHAKSIVIFSTNCSAVGTIFSYRHTSGRKPQTQNQEIHTICIAKLPSAPASLFLVKALIQFQMNHHESPLFTVQKIQTIPFMNTYMQEYTTVTHPTQKANASISSHFSQTKRSVLLSPTPNPRCTL